MNTQPEALRLAEVLDLLAMDMKTPRQAAAELRRLHEENQRLKSDRPVSGALFEAEEELRRAHALNAELLEIAKSAEGMVSNCDVSSGVCCCGDAMENHPNPMDCGHSFVDSGVYAANSLLKKVRATIAKAESKKKNPGVL